MISVSPPKQLTFEDELEASEIFNKWLRNIIKIQSVRMKINSEQPLASVLSLQYVPADNPLTVEVVSPVSKQGKRKRHFFY